MEDRACAARVGSISLQTTVTVSPAPATASGAERARSAAPPTCDGEVISARSRRDLGGQSDLGAISAHLGRYEHVALFPDPRAVTSRLPCGPHVDRHLQTDQRRDRVGVEDIGAREGQQSRLLVPEAREAIRLRA